MLISVLPIERQLPCGAKVILARPFPLYKTNPDFLSHGNRAELRKYLEGRTFVSALIIFHITNSNQPELYLCAMSFPHPPSTSRGSNVIFPAG